MLTTVTSSLDITIFQSSFPNAVGFCTHLHARQAFHRGRPTSKVTTTVLNGRITDFGICKR